MNYSSIKQNLISLGFAEESDYSEYEELGYTYSAINRAIDKISKVFPYVKKYEKVIDNTVTGIIGIDMGESVNDFLKFADVPVKHETSSGSAIYEKFLDYEIDADGCTLWLDADENKGKFWINYNAKPTDIDSTTSDSFVPEIPANVHHLIPLLSAYYLWLDDDATKAAQYYNEYETSLNEIVQFQNAPRMRVVTDRKWGYI